MGTTNIQCLGFIMDGNRRWARDNQLFSSLEGHLKGCDVLHECVSWAEGNQIPNIVFYGFSTENWQRSKEEVSYLMELFESELKVIAPKEINVRVVGRYADFSSELIKVIKEAEAANSVENKTTVWLAASYGGRAEIIEAVNKAVAHGEEVNEEMFEKLLWTADMPDPDMIIRTGGEQRLSNFLTWKSTYSELYFIEKHWPALTSRDFDDILVEYEGRHRRKGK